MRRLLLFGCVLLIGCQHDPHTDLYLTTKPQTEEIPGTYVLERFDLPPQADAVPSIMLEIRSDHTFLATNVPSDALTEPDAHFFSSFLNGVGNWKEAKVGSVGPRSLPIWGLELQSSNQRFSPAILTGKIPPYGLIFVIGDPDSGNAVILKRKR